MAFTLAVWPCLMWAWAQAVAGQSPCEGVDENIVPKGSFLCDKEQNCSGHGTPNPYVESLYDSNNHCKGEWRCDCNCDEGYDTGPFSSEAANCNSCAFLFVKESGGQCTRCVDDSAIIKRGKFVIYVLNGSTVQLGPVLLVNQDCLLKSSSFLSILEIDTREGWRVASTEETNTSGVEKTLKIQFLTRIMYERRSYTTTGSSVGRSVLQEVSVVSHAVCTPMPDLSGVTKLHIMQWSVGFQFGGNGGSEEEAFLQTCSAFCPVSGTLPFAVAYTFLRILLDEANGPDARGHPRDDIVKEWAAGASCMTFLQDAEALLFQARNASRADFMEMWQSRASGSLRCKPFVANNPADTNAILLFTPWNVSSPWYDGPCEEHSPNVTGPILMQEWNAGVAMVQYASGDTAIGWAPYFTEPCSLLKAIPTSSKNPEGWLAAKPAASLAPPTPTLEVNWLLVLLPLAAKPW